MAEKTVGQWPLAKLSQILPHVSLTSPLMSASQVTISTGTKRARRPSTTRLVKKSKSKTSSKVNSIVSLGRAFPLKAKTCLRYVEDLGGSLNPGGGSYAQLFWKCNGLFDPNDALGGHQPYGFDQYAALYNHYRVWKSVCTVEFFNSPDYKLGFTVGLNITPGASDPDAPQTKMEKATKRTYAWICENKPTHSTSLTWYAKDYFGAQKNEDSMSAAVTADPTELSHFEVWCQNNSGASAFCGARITIDYYVEFTEPKNFGGS